MNGDACSLKFATLFPALEIFIQNDWDDRKILAMKHDVRVAQLVRNGTPVDVLAEFYVGAYYQIDTQATIERREKSGEELPIPSACARGTASRFWLVNCRILYVLAIESIEESRLPLGRHAKHSNVR
jgi:hypothetical protein